MVFFDDNIFILSFILIGLYVYILTHQYPISDVPVSHTYIYTYIIIVYFVSFFICAAYRPTFSSRMYTVCTLHMTCVYDVGTRLELPSVGIGRSVRSRSHKSRTAAAGPHCSPVGSLSDPSWI